MKSYLETQMVFLTLVSDTQGRGLALAELHENMCLWVSDLYMLKNCSWSSRWLDHFAVHLCELVIMGRVLAGFLSCS